MAHELLRVAALIAWWIGTDPAAYAEPIPAAPSIESDPALTRPLAPLDTLTSAPPASRPPRPSQPKSVRYGTEVRGLAEVGLQKAFRHLSQLEIGRGKAASRLQIDARARNDRDLVERLLRTNGYYQGEVQVTTMAEGQAGTFRVLVTVAPGRQFRFSTVTVTGAPTEPPSLARKALTLRSRDPIVATQVRAAEANVALRLPQEGYPFAKVGERDITLDPSDAEGDYTLPVSPGPKASFGGIDAHEPVFDQRHLAVIARFKRGEPYDSRKIDDFNRALVATRLFSVVSVEPVDAGQRAADGTEVADLRVDGRAGPSHALSAGLGYETGAGFKVTGAWSDLNLFPPEGSLTINAVAGTQQQQLALQFARSNDGQRDRTVFAEAQTSRDTTNAYVADIAGVDAHVSRESTPIWQKRWTYSAGAEAEVMSEQAYDLALGAKVWRAYKIAGLRLSGGYDRSNSLLNPTRGFQILATLDPEAQFGGGTHGFLKGDLEGRVYVPATAALTLAGRVRVGALLGVDAQQLAPSRRFYEGGGENIRGYAYQEVGPKAPDGSPIGGASSTDFSFEARYRFGDFGVVPFLDGGQVYEAAAPRFADFRYGAGLGVRYYTNFGPIRIDVGTPIGRRPGESAVGVYISIGQAF